MNEPGTQADGAFIKAEDRTKRTPEAGSEVKTARFPRTTRRMLRIEGVLRRRQPSLAIVLEDVHDPHNVSAVLRSCDAVGVLDVHLVYVHDQAPAKAFNRAASGSAAKWVRTYIHDSIDACYRQLRDHGFRIHAAALRDDSRDLYALDLTAPTALVFGNEQRGVTDEAADFADATVTIPMQGMVESLNISVACAVTLYEAMRQRRTAGMYDEPQLDSAEMARLRDEWIRR